MAKENAVPALRHALYVFSEMTSELSDYGDLYRSDRSNVRQSWDSAKAFTEWKAASNAPTPAPPSVSNLPNPLQTLTT